MKALRYLPNLICLGRIALIWPILATLAAHDYGWAAVCFGVAGVSDLLNGGLAKRFGWTSELGNAFLSQQPDVMDAVQRERHKAQQYGYLRSNEQIVVGGGPYVTINPVDPGYIVVPYYDPGVVFFAPRPGFFVGGGIRFGFGVGIGGFFRPWGWGYSRFDWGGHRLYINDHPWGRTWVNRGVYVHPYEGVRRFGPGARVAERHEVHPRSDRERSAQREGRRVEEEHRGGDHRH